MFLFKKRWLAFFLYSSHLPGQVAEDYPLESELVHYKVNSTVLMNEHSSGVSRSNQLSQAAT